MSTMIGRLAVALQMDSTSFVSGSKRAAAEVNALGGSMDKAGARVSGMGKAVVATGGLLAGSAIATQLKAMVVQGLEYASSLGEQAKQLGVTAKALQEYRYIASQVGVEQGDMEASLAKLTRTMGEAMQGAKGPSDAFRKLGIDVGSFVAAGGDAGDLIPLIADRLQQFKSPAEQVAIGADLMGKNFQKLAPLMAEGSAGINAMRDAVAKLGFVMSDAMIAKADLAADKMGALGQVLTGKIAIAVTERSDEVMELGNALGWLVEKAADAVKQLRIFQFEVAAFKFGIAGSRPMRWLGVSEEESATFREGAAKLKKGANDLRYGTGLASYRSRPLLGVSPESTPAAPVRWPGGAGGALLKKQPPTISKKWIGGSTAPSLMRNNLWGGTKIAGLDFAPGGLDRGAAGAIGDWQAERVAQIDAFLEDQGIPALDRYAAKAESTSETTKRSFANMAGGTIASLERMADAMQSSGLLGKLAAFSNLAVQLGSIGLFGSKIANNINIPKRAMGGPVMAGRLHLVGERGPELYVPNANGTIIPNHAMGAFGSGGNPTRIEVIPSRYFDVVVDGRISQAAPVIASAGGKIGAGRMQQRSNWILR